MARNSLRVMPGLTPAMVAAALARIKPARLAGAHSSLVLHIYELPVQRLFQLNGLASGRAQARMADEPGKWRVGARERAQQALMKGALQVGSAVIPEEQWPRRECEQAGICAL